MKSAWEPAGPAYRLFAFIMDIALLLLLGRIAQFLGKDIWGHPNFSYPWLAIFLLYFTFWTGYSGQTLGKWAFNLRVTDSLGLYPVSYARALIRSIFYLLEIPLLGLGLLWALWNTERKSWHDIISGTRVYRV